MGWHVGGQAEVQLSPIHLLVMQRRGPIRPLVLTLTDLVQWISNSWSMTNIPTFKNPTQITCFYYAATGNWVAEIKSTPILNDKWGLTNDVNEEICTKRFWRVLVPRTDGLTEPFSSFSLFASFYCISFLSASSFYCISFLSASSFASFFLHPFFNPSKEAGKPWWIRTILFCCLIEYLM